MNFAFTLLFLSSALVLLWQNPADLLPALLLGGTKAASLCVSLLSSYALWLGLMRVWEQSGVTRGVSKLLKKPVRALFKIERDDTLEATCMNLSANLLGLGSVATPYGVKAATLMEREPRGSFASSMLFIVNATSLQLFPASVIAFRTSLLSANPADILLPTLLCTVFSTLIGVIFAFVFLSENARVFSKTARAGARL